MENEEKFVSKIGDYCTYAIISKVKKDDGKFETIVEDVFSMKVHQVNDYMTRLLNDVSSPYYYDNKNMFLAELCFIDGDSAIVSHVNVVPKILCPIVEYVRLPLRRYQQTIQTLNYTPQGYYKKSEEERKEIQSRIDSAIVDYVAKYVAPDISDQITDDQVTTIKDILNNANSVNSNVKH